jgi:hypothetical protein
MDEVVNPKDKSLSDNQSKVIKIIIVIILFYIKKMHLSKCSVFHHHYENQLQETISKFSDFNQLNFINCNFTLNITDLRLRPEKNIQIQPSYK